MVVDKICLCHTSIQLKMYFLLEWVWVFWAARDLPWPVHARLQGALCINLNWPALKPKIEFCMSSDVDFNLHWWIYMMNQNPGEPHGDHWQHWQEMFPDGSWQKPHPSPQGSITTTTITIMTTTTECVRHSSEDEGGRLWHWLRRNPQGDPLKSSSL